ncbi:MAG: PSD1 and planctomycete cytochrome C domain-containing protein [Planctomycetota bacterium]|nr:PSD1 and planctomycete cytochrome C domain-containing protein [Planctomycetota bacterium]
MIGIRIPSIAALTLLLGGSVLAQSAPAPTEEDVAFFEKRVRPVLAERCYRCHSSRAKRLKGGLRLDSREALLRGGDRGPAIKPGEPLESLLVRAVSYRLPDLEMPPDGKLSERTIADLTLWVKKGAPWPGEKPARSPPSSSSYDWSRSREHWAFRPVRRPTPPRVEDVAWPRHPVDRFVLARLEAAGMEPAPPADRRTLIRRAYLDLIGLPPAPEEVEAFVTDSRPDAFARVVDRLLASPRHGERWARHWLDVARYSEGYGTGFDGGDKPSAWRYRDWVTSAFNDDLPYDRFVVRQIAGDLLGADADHRATGFLALGPTYTSDGGDPESIAKARADTLEDRMDTTFRAFLGLTVACARCHDHKFDPIPTEDYYSVAAAFQNTKPRDHPVAPEDVVRRYDERQQAIRELTGRVKKAASAAKKAAPAAKKAGRGSVPAEKEEELRSLRAQLERLKKTAPPKYPVVHAVADSGSSDMHVALRGDLRKKGEVAPRRFLRILAGKDRPRWTEGSGRRQLARALASPDNPLTARVLVNRVWMHHFGRAIVRTPSNLGTLGDQPTHPELLDWLASRFVEGGWSLKDLHRTIMLSAAYRMSSRFNEANYRTDSDNRHIWRMNSRRLEVEAWRDSVLAVTGELDDRLGGESTKRLLESRRRTLYSVVSRNGDRFESDSFLRLFDFPAARMTSPKRAVSTVPQQCLFLLNSPFMIERARALAERLAREEPGDAQRIDRAYRLLYSRAATGAEKAAGLAFLASAGRGRPSWQHYAQVLLSSHEFMEIQ